MKTLLIFLLLTISLTTFGQRTQIETGDLQSLAKWRSANYSDIRYKLNVTLNKSAPLMNGDIEISFKLTVEGVKNDLILDWRTAQFENDKDRPFANVQKVNDTFFLYGAVQPKDGHLTIPKTALKEGENLIKIQFASQIKTSGAGVLRYMDKQDGAEYVYSQFSAGKNTAFPVFDQPDLKAKFQLSLTVPAGWEVVSNSILEKYPFAATIKPEGVFEHLKATFNFKETLPISTNVFAFAAGEFGEIKDEADIGLVKTAPIGSTKIYEPLKNPNAAKVYVRKSQEQKFRQNAAEFFLQNRKSNKLAKLDIILLPEVFNTQSEYDGIKFVPESAAFR